MIAWLLLVGAILSEVTATLSLRGALDRPLLYIVVVIGYALSFGCLALVLRRGMALGVAYGIWAACGVVLTAALSAVLFGEAFTAMKISGVVLIAAGVAVVEIGSHRARRREGAGSTPDLPAARREGAP
ncbi:cation transporter [Brachybacterium sp. P6-10-X1]|uniref:DMT family transporter n=1 Tax=Brachybacterium sp. P6-10-X1 TaxID=1903186 RepID=UPI000971B31C|nr:multidrug efflux SMR transporter [Brachybacterium sp. P6-10-X1]APX33441.1 cation transporter [Brachybacterium sp. P6-10-X1]